MLGSLRDAIRRWDEQFGTDDARLWAEVLGAVLVLGLFLRASVHVFAAIAADEHLPEGCDPHLAGTDISLRSPIVGLDGHRLDPGVRVVTAVVGIGAWALLVPVPRPSALVEYWLMLNLAVPIADPLAYVGLVVLESYRSPTDADTDRSPTTQ